MPCLPAKEVIITNFEMHSLFLVRLHSAIRFIIDLFLWWLCWIHPCSSVTFLQSLAASVLWARGTKVQVLLTEALAFWGPGNLTSGNGCCAFVPWMAKDLRCFELHTYCFLLFFNFRDKKHTVHYCLYCWRTAVYF